MCARSKVLEMATGTSEKIRRTGYELSGGSVKPKTTTNTTDASDSMKSPCGRPV